MNQEKKEFQENLNIYRGTKKDLEKVLNYIPFFTQIEERDYIIYHNDRSFEYTPEMYEFIKALFDAKLVEDYEQMMEFVKQGDCEDSSSNCYNQWVREMNQTICRPALLCEVDLSFIRKAFLTLIRLEKVIPGSWGIDIEVGTWLKLLRQLKQISNSWQPHD
jgi:hypothetical protein